MIIYLRGVFWGTRNLYTVDQNIAFYRRCLMELNSSRMVIMLSVWWIISSAREILTAIITYSSLWCGLEPQDDQENNYLLWTSWFDPKLTLSSWWVGAPCWLQTWLSQKTLHLLCGGIPCFANIKKDEMSEENNIYLLSLIQKNRLSCWKGKSGYACELSGKMFFWVCDPAFYLFKIVLDLWTEHIQ